MNDGTKMLIGHIYEMKNRWNAGISTITNRSVSNSECGPVCDFKTVAEVSKNRRCYPTTSIRSTKNHNPSPRPISGNKCVTPEGQSCQSTGFDAHSRHRNTNFETNCLQETQSCWPEDQQLAFPSRLRISALVSFGVWNINIGNVGEMASVMLRDEFRFSLSSDSRWVTIWRERGTRFESRNMKERHHFPSRAVMVWTGIMKDRRTDINFFDTGSVTGKNTETKFLSLMFACFEVLSVLTSY
ncbi:transposable element Tc3 transposase [Trichonephila clavipes]|nr:transposable element Tc3 transposase [Trichonephila clavipes]